MAWIEYHTALRDHWKIKRLSTLLEVDYPYALGVISCLWLWVAEYAQNGNVSRFTSAEIQDAARCNMQKFSLETLKKCELVDERGFINDWNHHGLKLLKSTRKRVKECRERKRYSNVTVTPTNLTNLTNLTNQYTHLESEVFKTCFKNYLEMRLKIKKPATDKAIELALGELKKYSLETAIKMLEQSILNSWQGIFPLKNNKSEPYRNKI